jgi:hypothetical protein
MATEVMYEVTYEPPDCIFEQEWCGPFFSYVAAEMLRDGLRTAGFSSNIVVVDMNA